MRRWHVRAGRGERGQSLVEFVLVLPLLLAIMMAIIDFGRLYQANVSLTNAVRDGARAGAFTGSASEAQNRVAETAENLGINPGSVSVTMPTIAGEEVIVTATVTVNLITPLGPLLNLAGGSGMNASFSMTRTGNMRRE